MLFRNSKQPLTRRGSKQLVEMVIGIIGILGLMLAQAGECDNEVYLAKLNASDQSISAEESRATPKIDWLELLF